MSVPVVAFPEDVQLRARRPRTLVFLVKLLYGSGAVLAAVYALAILVVMPLLNVQFERRLDMLHVVKTRLTEVIYQKIAGRFQDVPNVLVKYGDKLYSDATVQTDDDAESSSASHRTYNHRSVMFADESPRNKDKESRAVDLNAKLAKLRDTVVKLKLSSYGDDTKGNFNDSHVEPDKVTLGYTRSEMQPLKFQLQQLDTHLSMMNEDIFRRKVKGYEYFNRSQRAATANGHRSANIVESLKKDIQSLREHALKGYSG